MTDENPPSIGYPLYFDAETFSPTVFEQSYGENWARKITDFADEVFDFGENGARIAYESELYPNKKR